ncbi:MAG: hypothetical protein PHX87_06345 [Candidatus Peribacteraceae bacterium]|nr:hypothetical protein [Candidatus Peribacteraceae bacterium]MDD5743011.1 hypothetical protein [Candidatus Peribacteraceae bacterium]
MVYNRNLLVVALCGVLVSVIAGIGAMQYAQVIAFSGMNPNTAQTEPGIEKQERTCVNPRSIMENLFSGFTKQRPCPVVQEQKPQAAQEMHAAPPVVEPVSEDCAETTNARRRAACNAGTRLINETNR